MVGLVSMSAYARKAPSCSKRIDRLISGVPGSFKIYCVAYLQEVTMKLAAGQAQSSIYLNLVGPYTGNDSPNSSA